MDGQYLKVFVDWLERYQKLSDAEFGRLMRAAIAYRADGGHGDLSGREELLLDGIKLDIDRDRAKYGTVCDARSEAGKKGAQKKWGTSSASAKRSERLADARAISRHTKQEWDEMIAFFGYLCVKCGNTESEIVKDHIVPIYQGGSDGIDNLQPLCISCNSSKGPESVDYRISFAEQNNINMPSKWLANAWQRLAMSGKNGQDKDKDKDKDDIPPQPPKGGAVMIPPEIRDEFAGYIEARKKGKSPMTDRAVKLALGELEKLAPKDFETQKRIVNQSVMYGWKGLFPLGTSGNGLSAKVIPEQQYEQRYYDPAEYDGPSERAIEGARKL